MSNWTVPLADLDLGEAEIAAVTQVLRTQWLSMGPVTNAIRYTGATPVFVDITSATDLNLAQTQHLNHEPPTVWNTLLSNKLWRGDAFEHREHLLGVREAKTSVAPSGVYPAC